MGVAASLLALLLAACSGGTTSTPSAAAPSGTPRVTSAPTLPPSTVTPSATPGASTDAPPTPLATPVPTATATATAGATATATGWVERFRSGAPAPRTDHTWTVDDSGTVAYLFGGRVGGGGSAELWRFDLASDEWAIVEPGGAAPAPRWGHTATWVAGTGLVVWSGQGNNGFFADIWAYDPTTSAWRELPALGDVPEARYGSCAALGPDGRLWVSHGFTQDDGRFADTRAYDFATGEWQDVTPSGRVPLERCLHDCWWSADGTHLILYGGQTTGVAALGDAWAYELATGDWTASVDGAAPARNLYGLAASGDGALILGGGSLDGGFLDDAWLLDEATLAMTELELGPGPAARAGSTLIADDARGRLLLFGGEGESGLLGDLWEIGQP